jgi:hypothetical protein
MDRGYISGPFIGELKQKYEVDALIPLRSNMHSYIDAVQIANQVQSNKWEKISESKDESTGKIVTEEWINWIQHIDLWDSCPVKQHAVVSKKIEWNDVEKSRKEHIWVLGTTRCYSHPRVAVARYKLRSQTEERYRQFKLSWNIGKFPSPHPSLIESHISFVLLTYSLLQLYLRRADLREYTHQMIQTLKREEDLGKNVVLVYAGNSFAVLDLDDYSLILIDLKEKPKEKIKEVLLAQKGARMARAL